MSTIHSVLSGRGPVLWHVKKDPSKTKFNPKWVEIDSDHVFSWKEFTLAHLQSAFKDILNIRPSGDARDAGSMTPTYPINGVRDVKEMAVRHLQPLLRYPIADGAAKIGERIRRQFPVISMEVNKPLTSSGAPFWPALSIFLDGESPGWLVLSAARMDAAWNSRSLAEDHPSTVALQPLRQLATYARNGGTPYTFIVTEEEVVVVRFFLVESGQPDHYGAEWKAIPWDAASSNALTGNLAIWFLVMMALDENHRKVQGRVNTQPVNAWRRFTDSEGVVRYRNWISKEVSDDLPAKQWSIEPRWLLKTPRHRCCTQ